MNYSNFMLFFVQKTRPGILFNRLLVTSEAILDARFDDSLPRPTTDPDSKITNHLFSNFPKPIFRWSLATGKNPSGDGLFTFPFPLRYSEWLFFRSFMTQRTTRHKYTCTQVWLCFKQLWDSLTNFSDSFRKSGNVGRCFDRWHGYRDLYGSHFYSQRLFRKYPKWWKQVQSFEGLSLLVDKNCTTGFVLYCRCHTSGFLQDRKKT